MIRVLLVDDQDLVRAGLRAMLANAPDIEVIAEARHGEEAIQSARLDSPDIVLMDIRMPIMDGIEATRRILSRTLPTETRVVILTTFDDDEDIIDAVRAGAAGYLLKDAGAEQLRGAVRTVFDGGNLLSPQITKKVMAHMAAQPAAESPEPVDLSDLTERERQVLGRVAEGETNAEIGAALHLSPATARTYVSRILTKLHARDRTELAIMAHRSGLMRD